MSAWERDSAELIADFQPNGQTPGFREVVAVAMAPIMRDAMVAGWPVATGLSVAGWRTRGSVVYNDVEYVPFVRDGLADRLWAAAVADNRAMARSMLLDLINRTPASGGGGLALRRRSAGGARVGVSVRDSITGAMPPTRTAPPPIRPPASTRPPLPSEVLAATSRAIAGPRQVQAALRALAPYSVPADVLAFVSNGHINEALRLLSAAGSHHIAATVRAAVRAA